MPSSAVTPAFVHCHVHSAYSIVDGLLDIDALVQAAVRHGMPALALTDQDNLFAVVKFYQAARQAGVKPMIGAELCVTSDMAGYSTALVVVLCQNTTGYINLNRLLSHAYVAGQTQVSVGPKRQSTSRATVPWSLLQQYAEGLLVLSLGAYGVLGQCLLAQDKKGAVQALQTWRKAFGDRFYLAIERAGDPIQAQALPLLVAFAAQHQVPLVATHGVRFLARQDYTAHEARVCVHQGQILNDEQRQSRYRPEQYFTSAAEMQQLFADLPTALTNTGIIAQRCNLELRFDRHFLPNFPIPEDEDLSSFFRRKASEGLAARLAGKRPDPFPEANVSQTTSLPPLTEQTITGADQLAYQTRLDSELAVIESMGFAGYFLIVADFINWACHNDIPVGPGRGSGAGSLVAYALGITDVDPLPYGLLFERFLNPERVSMPDFDIDFCMVGRDRVIDYVATRYGRDNVAQIITYGTMAARAVIRDVGRVLGYPYGLVDGLAKLVPFEIGMTLSKAMAQEDQLRARYQKEPEVASLLDLAQTLEGLPRNVGKHAGGVVIAPSALTDFTALYCEEPGGSLVTQLDKDDIERIGLVKFDFLGLRTLTIIDWTLKAIHARQADSAAPRLCMSTLPLDDAKTFALLQACETTAVFQLESRGMKDLMKRLVPDSFEDVVALVALFRPGPLQSGMVDDFIARKHGLADVAYAHPDIADILQPTYGVILYQEQVMQIAQVLANYSLGAADILRRAMGKKKPAEMAKQRAIFMDGALERGVAADTATQIFDSMEKFAGYGFNKSHSVAYALLSYQTAWLKAHYPAEFMAAVLSADMDHTDKIVVLVRECRRMGLKLLPPDINQSAAEFTVTPAGDIRYGLAAIKGVGQAAIEDVLQRRAELQSPDGFADLFELCRKVDGQKMSRRVLEACIKAGAFDGLGAHRATLLASIDTAVNAAAQQQKNQASGQGDLFAEQSDLAEMVAPAYVRADAWSARTRLSYEKDVLGFYFSGHPIELDRVELQQMGIKSIADSQPVVGKTLRCAGYLASLRRLINRKQQKFAALTLEDDAQQLDVVLFAELYAETREQLSGDQLLIIEGEVGEDRVTGGFKITANLVYTLTQARQTWGRCLRLRLDDKLCTPAWINTLQETLMPFRGGPLPVLIDYHLSTSKGRLALPQSWWVTLESDLLSALTMLCGEDRVQVGYAHNPG